MSGSAELALHGVPVAPRDVDVVTDAAGVTAFAELLAGVGVETPYEGSSVRAETRLLFVLHDVRVEVLGNVSHRRPDGSWSPPASACDDTSELLWRGQPAIDAN